MHKVKDTQKYRREKLLPPVPHRVVNSDDREYTLREIQCRRRQTLTVPTFGPSLLPDPLPLTEGYSVQQLLRSAATEMSFVCTPGFHNGPVMQMCPHKHALQLPAMSPCYTSSSRSLCRPSHKSFNMVCYHTSCYKHSFNWNWIF